MNKLAQAKAHAQTIFENDGFKYLSGGKVEPALLQEAAYLLEHEQQLPWALGTYAAWALRIQSHKLNGTRARIKETNHWRNLFIAKTVREMEQFGFKPTRNPEQKSHQCGCSIVAAVLVKLGFKNERGRKWSEGAVIKVRRSILRDQRRRALAKQLLATNKKPAAGLSLFALSPD